VTPASAGAEGVDPRDLVGREPEPPDVEVRGDALGFADFGITTVRVSTCQRRITCVGSTPCASATALSTGSSRRLALNGL
jgi:hypothetical protein